MEKAILTYEESIPPMVKLVSSNPLTEEIMFAETTNVLIRTLKD